MDYSRGAKLLQLAILNKAQRAKVERMKENARESSRMQKLEKLKLKDLTYTPSGKRHSVRGLSNRTNLSPRSKVCRWLKFTDDSGYRKKNIGLPESSTLAKIDPIDGKELNI